MSESKTLFVPNGYIFEAGQYICPACDAKFPLLPQDGQCPFCGQSHTKSNRIRQVALTLTNRQIMLSIPKSREEVSFHTGSGHVVFRSGDSIRDVTEHKALWENSDCYDVLGNCKVKLHLHRILQKAWGTFQLPVPPEALTRERMMQYTRFVGYPDSFYTLIPYLEDNPWKLPKALKKTARRMHHSQDLPKLVNTTRTGHCKSIRRMLYRNPALLFFHAELDFLWAAIQDVNQFCQLLAIEDHYLFRNLAFLQTFPGARQFVLDYIREAGFRKYAKLIRYREVLETFACYYSCQSPSQQKKAQQHFRRSPRENPFGQLKVLYNLPTRQVSLPDITIHIPGGGSYVFRALKNSLEYQDAGTRLHNCLAVHPNCSEPPVMVVWKGGQTAVAAIQIHDHTILDAAGQDNQALAGELLEAYTLWKQYMHLEEGSSYTEPDDEEFYCF